MAKQQTKTDALGKLTEEARAASHEHHEAQAEAQAAQDELGRRRDAASEAHASGGDVAGALKAYHAAERTLDEAKIKIDGIGRKADRARAAVDGFMREHHMALLKDVEPADQAAEAEERELLAKLVGDEARKTDIRNKAARYVSASGHSPRGNVLTPDALSEVMPVLQDIASGLRPLASALPNWKHRHATEAHHRAQAEAIERQQEDRHERAGVGI